MHIDTLIKMANQIGDFFDAMPDRTEALEGVAAHLRKFWAPGMRRELLAHIEAHGDTALKPLVAKALAAYRSTLV